MKSLTVHEFRNGLVASSLPNSAGCKHQHHDVFAMTSAVAGHITLKVLIRVRASKEQRGALPDGHLQLHRMPVGIVRASESKCGAVPPGNLESIQDRRGLRRTLQSESQTRN